VSRRPPRSKPLALALGCIALAVELAACAAPFDADSTPPLARPRKERKAGFDPTASAFDDFGEGAESAVTSTAVSPNAELSRHNLSSYDLRGQKLDRARLRLAKLTRALLERASLREVDARGAILVEARAREVDFSGANLSGIKAQRADFARANFRGAQLVAANLYGANLSGADLRGASLFGAVLISTRLENARIDEHTTLPFDRAEARALGMVLDEER
jgi:uncharacterized protein YjbI with pentapeptide repeats